MLSALDLWVILGAVLLSLALRYPDRLIFTSPSRDAPEGVPFVLPLIGALASAPSVAWQDPSLLRLFLHGLRDAPPNTRDAHKYAWPRTSTFPVFGRVYMINRPEHLEHVQRNRFENYVKGEIPRRLFGSFLGRNGIFLSDGAIWASQRKLANSIFAAGRHGPVTESVVHGQLDDLRSLLGSVAEVGATINLQDVFMRFTLDSFGLIALGHPFGTLPSHVSGLAHDDPFAKALDYVQTTGNGRIYVVGWQVVEWLLPYGYRMRRNTRLIHDTIYGIIDARLEARRNDPLGAEKSDLLGLFMEHIDDRKQLMETTLAFIFAGRDTTAQALSWLSYDLLHHPTVVERCRDEIATVLGAPEVQRDMVFADVVKLPYLNAVLHEGLRLHPSVPKNMRELVEDDVLPPIPEEGVPAIAMQKGNTVIWSDWVMARTPAVWGEDCSEFKPERFLDESGRLKHYSPFKWQAFNSGPRRCLGASLATYEAMAIIATVLGRWDLRLAPGTKPPRPRPSLTLPIWNPYHVSVSPRAA